MADFTGLPAFPMPHKAPCGSFLVYMQHNVPSVEDSKEKKGESLLASTPVVVLSAILGRTPTIEEYKTAVKGITLTKFAPPIDNLKTSDSIHF